jgi:hypothetical protein
MLIIMLLKIRSSVALSPPVFRPVSTDARRLVISDHLPYFPAHKTHRDFFIRNFIKKMMMNVF